MPPADEDRAARNEALSDFLLTTKAAHDHTDGPLWGALTHVPSSATTRKAYVR